MSIYPQGAVVGQPPQAALWDGAEAAFDARGLTDLNVASEAGLIEQTSEGGQPAPPRGSG
jgi:hypothetical protein